MEYLLIPENVDNYNVNNQTLQNLLKIDYEINTLELTYEENEIFKALEEVLEKNDKNKNIKKSNSIIDVNTIIKFISFAVPFGLFLLYNSMRMLKKEHKKEMDEGTKELLELIKERGKNSPHYNENTKDDKKRKDEISNDKPKQD